MSKERATCKGREANGERGCRVPMNRPTNIAMHDSAHAYTNANTSVQMHARDANTLPTLGRQDSSRQFEGKGSVGRRNEFPSASDTAWQSR